MTERLTKEQALPRVSPDTATTSQLSPSNSGIMCCEGEGRQGRAV